jgi:hypothetical protein
MINLETPLNHFLQRNISFIIDNKVVKRGKLILFSVQDYYMTFYLKHGEDQKRYELPYPYTVSTTNNSMTLNYSLTALAQNNDELLFKIQGLTKKKNCKTYNNVVSIVED